MKPTLSRRALILSAAALALAPPTPAPAAPPAPAPPIVPRMLFMGLRGWDGAEHPAPLWGNELDGSPMPIRPGEYELDAAATHFNIPADTLRRLWFAIWGRVWEATDAA